MFKKKSSKRKAIDKILEQTVIIQSGSAFPSHINIAADYMRLYLGEKSHIYQSFAEIDIRYKSNIALNMELRKANELLQAAAQYISDNDVYKDVQIKLWEAQIKDSKRKILYGFLAAIGGAMLSHAEGIIKYLLLLFRLPPPQ